MIKKIVKKILASTGYAVVNLRAKIVYGNPDMEEEFFCIRERCKDFTLVPIERMYSLYKATEYVVKNDIPGDIIEFGVWRGGSSMLVALTLLKMNHTARKIYLYDTYEGMTEPTERDFNVFGVPAKKSMPDFKDERAAPLEAVKKNMFSTGYPQDKIIFVKGRVEDTIPKILPERIALVRLDTDLYESEYHELCNAFPRLSPQGVIILDNYGFWKGTKEAADKYFAENKIKIFLQRTDFSERVGIKI